MSRDLYIKAKTPINSLIADMFEGRVLADGGTFEAKNCLVNSLDLALFQQASLIITPNGRKAGKIYALKPFNGSGDLTVVRATPAKETNASGYTVDVPQNIARFDYTDSICPDILSQPQRTNLALRSQEFSNSIWTTNGNQVTISENSTTDPEGTNFADAILTTSENSNHYIQQRTGTAIAGTIYTMSIYVKYLGYDYCRIQSSNTATAYATFRFSTKELILGGANVVANNGKVTEMKDGWFRIEMSILPAFSVTWRWWVIVLDNSMNETFIGDVSKGLYVYGFQFESGANATSYIPTVASAVTRNADVISKTGISDLIGQTEGTMYVEIKAISDDNVEKHITISDGTNVNRIDLFYGFYGAGKVYYEVRAANSVQGGLLNGNLSVESMNKIAVVYKTNRFELWINGTKVAQDLIGNTFSGSTLSTLQTSLPNGTMRFFGSINSIALFKTALTDTQLLQLTTP